MLRSSPVNAIRLAMVAIVAAADLADSVSGEPERVYRPKWIGIEVLSKQAPKAVPLSCKLARLFSSKSEWIGPNGLLLCSATRPALDSES